MNRGKNVLLYRKRTLVNFSNSLHTVVQTSVNYPLNIMILNEKQKICWTMTAVDSVEVKHEGIIDNTFIESVKHQEEMDDVQRYVADYVQYRIHLFGGHYPQLPELPAAYNSRQFELVRAVALIFEKKHEEELKSMVTSLCQRGRLTFQRYVEVVEYFARNDDESPAQLSYGRLVALISFAGLVATRLCDMNLFPEVSMISSYTIKFLQKRIALTWQQDERSWAKFFDLAKTIIKLDDAERKEELVLKPQPNKWFIGWWPLAIFCILGLGGFTLMKTMLRTR